MRFFIYLSYDGAAYAGWQIQPNAHTIQAQLEDDLSLILRAKTPVVGAGRTDTGVNAREMVAHFDADISLDEAEALKYKLNRLLPRDIFVHRIVPVLENAHARFSALSRTYRYYTTSERDPFVGKYFHRIFRDLDFEKMNKAAEALLEYTDFQCFSKVRTSARTFTCHISEAHWQPLTADALDCIPTTSKRVSLPTRFVFTISADRFLRNMVRAIVGSLFFVGSGKIGVEDFREIILSSDRTKAGNSAPGNALFLEKISYPPDIFLK